MDDGLTGDFWVRVTDSALRESQKRWPKARDRMEVRRHALKLRFWPEKCPTTEHGILLDVDWEWIRALRDKRIAELRISDVIGGCDNIRIVFFVADKRAQDPLPVIWILAALQKKRDEWTKANLVTFDASASSCENDTTAREWMLRTGPSNECQVEESIMAVMEQEYSRELHALFAKCLHAYLECSTEVQAVIRDMVNIVISPESDEDEREMALFTMASALFPEYDGGAAGVDAEEAERAYDENGPEGLAARVELDEQETTFAARLRQIMDRKNLTQVQLAEKARVGQPAISMMLNRKCRPQQRTVHKLAESLGVHPEELWPG